MSDVTVSDVPVSGKKKTPAIVVDLDGTLANLNGRNPYRDGQAACEQDLLREDVFGTLAELVMQTNAEVVIVSGRFETYMPQTLRWLEKHDIQWDTLLLRADDDMRSDDILKKELYEEFIEPYYHVLKVIDDRPKVIRMWQSLGLDVIDVGDGVEF